MLSANNHASQQEIDALNNHVRVISKQNDELSGEIDVFLQSNEMIR